MEIALACVSVVAVAVSIAFIVVVRYLLACAAREERRRERITERLMDRLTSVFEKPMPPEDTTDFLRATQANGRPVEAAPPTKPPFDIEAFFEHAKLTGLPDEEVRARLVHEGIMPPRVGAA